MIRRADAMTYASELIIDPSAHEKRRWVTKAHEDFWLWIAEDRIDEMRAALSGKETIRQWAYKQADEWLTHTETGATFSERVEEEMRA